MKITLQQTYNAPAQEVFAAFTDVAKSPEIIPGIKEVEILEGDSPAVVGTKWKEMREFMGKEAVETMWVTEIEAAKHYVVEAYSSGTRYVVTHTFTETGGVTTIEIVFDAQPQTLLAKLFSPFSSLMLGTTKKMLQEDMDSIKKYVER